LPVANNESALTTALAALCCGAMLIVISCSRGSVKADAGNAPPAVAVRAASAAVADAPVEVAGIGNVEAISSVDVKSRVTAPVVRVHFSEGQDVVKDELLFDLDAETYNRQIAEIEANIARDSANEKQNEANIAKDEVMLKNAELIANRGKQLVKEGIFSQEQTEQLVSNADAANASLAADRAALESAKAAGKADRARLQQTTLLLGYTQIRAPISGRAGAIAVKEGSLAKENDTTLVTILQTSPIYVSFSVPEDLLPEVRRYQTSGSLAVKAVTSDNKESSGVLSFIDNTVDTTTGTIRMKSSFENRERALWPGQFVNVRARLNMEHNRILVPSRTVETGPDGKYVWVINPSDSSVSMRNVQVLRNYTPAGQPEQAVIGDGLKPGEQVVSEGQLHLAPGAHVRLLAPNALAPKPAT
jgi:membrane fusion protein, multidrug efflux system